MAPTPPDMRHRYLSDLTGRYATNGPPKLDGLSLTPVLLVPEIRLYLAEDAVILWARLEADHGSSLPVPFWASAWAGGKAVARYLLDHPGIVAGKSVLDLGSGSGIAAIAAALAGGVVTANDTDPNALAAIALNAKANDVKVSLLQGDVLRDGISDHDVILAGDTLYTPALADRMLQFMSAMASRGSTVLIGDPGRGNLAHPDLSTVATYPIADSGFGDAQITHASVFQLTPPSGAGI